jgi:3-deoxy-D-manno-octulosonic-acid transferase
MWFALYQLLLSLAYPLVRLRLRWRARVEPEYGDRVEERFGRVPAGVPAGVIWFHTVSAGETIAAAPIIAELTARYPDVPFLVTTMTPTGSEQVRMRLMAGATLSDGDKEIEPHAGADPQAAARPVARPVVHCYAPYDFPWVLGRFFDRVRPRLLVLMETELWPNLLARASREAVPVLLVNGRLSARSARGYRRLGALTRKMLQRLTVIACQYPAHAERFLALGAAEEKLKVLGSVKFDVRLPDDASERVEALRQRWGLRPRRVWIAGSTHPGEDELLLRAHLRVRQRLPEARLILVPRHPSRCGEILALCRSQGLRAARQSQSAPDDAAADVVVGDVMGQLIYLYGLSEVAFVGGSLVPAGGHNPIEPALWGQPLLIGQAHENFPDVVERFAEAGSLSVVSGVESLAVELIRYLNDTEARRLAGAAAREVVMKNRGASGRLLALLGAQIDAAIAQ